MGLPAQWPFLEPLEAQKSRIISCFSAVIFIRIAGCFKAGDSDGIR